MGSNSTKLKDSVMNTMRDAGMNIATAAISAAADEITTILATQGRAAARVSIIAILKKAHVQEATATAVADRLIEATKTSGDDVPFYYDGAADGVHGGCDCNGKYVGSADMDLTMMSEYTNTVNSVGKGKIIEDLIEAIRKIGIKVESGDRTQQLKSILAEIPSGDKLKSTSESQKKSCLAIARAINSVYGTKVINTSYSPEMICQQVAEIIMSLSAGMHTEFLAVYEDVRRVLKNLHVMRDLLHESWESVKGKLDATDDSQLKFQVAEYEDAHKMIMAEMDRQIIMLEQLLNVSLTPADVTLQGLLTNQKDLVGYIEKLSTKPGSKGFSEVISRVLKGVGVTATLTHVIENALKTVGMTVEEYTREANLGRLQERFAKGLLGNTLTDEQLHQYLEATELLVRNFYKRQDIASAQVTGSSQMDTGVYGGASDYPKTALDKRIIDRQRMRNLIFSAFYRQINSLFDKFVESLHMISKKVGTEIPPSDQLDGLRQALQRIATTLTRDRQVYFSLIGYYNDAHSRARRDDFVAELKMLSSFFEAIVESPQYKASAQYFVAAQQQIKAILDLVDRYSAEIAAKFGRGEDAECPAPQMQGGDDDDEADWKMTGGADEDLKFEAPRINFTTTKSINDAIVEFDYNYRVSQIKYNMGRTNKELSHFAEDYDKLVANSIVEVLTKDKADYDVYREQAQKLADSPERTAILKFMDSQWDIKKKFWATLEAVDTYMRVFTDALVKSPSDIKEIRSMLDDVEVISSWHNDLSGNRLSAVFDSFPSAKNNATDAAHTDATKYEVEADSHYYSKIDAAYKPGDHRIVATAEKGVAALTQLKTVFNSMTVLKNLFSVFIHIGSRFGGEELRKKVFMTPTQMHANLVEYLQASAFTQGWKLKVDAKTVTSDDVTAYETALAAHIAGGGTVANFVYAAPANSPFGTHPGPVQKNIVLYGVSMRTVADNEHTDATFGKLTFDREDDMFVMLMKSIAAKVFTVTGMYDVMDRPMEFNGLSPIRMMIGGDDSTPKVEEGAVALYLRLPLLMLFYRKVFNFDDSEIENKYQSRVGIPMAGSDKLKFSMLPDIDGTFAGLIRLIFRKTKYIDSVAYSDDDIKEIIRECNNIWASMVQKYPQNTVMETIHELVNEVNRRYGIVVQEQANKYETEFGYRYDYNNEYGTSDKSIEDEPSRIPILPGEEDEEVSRPSAAQRLLGSAFDIKLESHKKSRYAITSAHKGLVRDFRCLIDKFFEDPKEEFTFNHAIKAAQIKLRRETSDEARFKIVAKLVRGTDVSSKIDSMKYIMFHETVITGLNTLSAIHTVLARFKRMAIVLSTDIMEKLICKHQGAAANAVALKDAIKTDLKTQGVFNTDGQVDEVDRMLASLDDPKLNAIKAIALGKTPAEIEVMRTGRQLRGGDKSDQEKFQKALLDAFDRKYMMKNLVDAIFTFAKDFQGLTEVQIESDRIQMSYSGLKKLIESMFSHVQYFLDVLRPHIKTTLFKQFTDKMTAGSFYWLQEQLMEKIVIGRSAFKDAAAKEAQELRYKSLDELFRGLSGTFQRITADKMSFDDVFAKMIYYDANEANSGVADESVEVVDFMHDPFEGLHLAGTADKRMLDTRFAARFKQLYTFEKSLTKENSALFMFNQLIAKYIQTFFDGTSQKIYAPLINQMAAGSFSRSVNDHLFTYPDVAPLVYVKRGAAGDVSGPPRPDVGLVLKDEIARSIPLIAEFMNFVLSKGIAPTDAFSAGGPWITGFNKEYVRYLVAKKISELFAAAPYVHDANIMGVLPAGAADEAAARRTWGDVFTTEAILKKIKAMSAADQEAIFAAAMLLPAFNTDIALRNVMRVRSAALARYELVKQIPSIVPGSSDMNADRSVRVMMFARTFSTLAQVLADLNPATAAKWAEEYDVIAKRSLASQKIYSEGSLSSNKTSVKYDDLLVTDISHIDPTAGNAPSVDQAALVLARKEALPGWLAADSIGGDLGSTGGRTDPASSALAALKKFGQRKDPDADHVLFTSLAVILRNLTSTRTATQTLVYLQENIADLPLYMKEKMRANLPQFRNLFQELLTRCEFLKQTLAQASVHVARTVAPTHNPWPYTLLDATTTSSETKGRWVGILDTIIKGCQTMIAMSEQGLKEIGDDPKYFETYQNSIRDYKTQYGVDPFMPMSSMMAFMKNAEPETKYDFLPLHSFGEDAFKYAYGVRSLLHQMKSKPQMEHSGAGFLSVLDGFNNLVDTRFQADRARVEGFATTLTTLARYLFEAKHIKAILTHEDMVNEFVKESDVNADNKVVVSIFTKPTKSGPCMYSVKHTLADVVRLTDSSFKEEKMKEFLEHICKQENGKDNNSLEIRNIIDLNIVPINVHAMMREIPLANIYNYAYTFDRMIVELFNGVGSENAKDLIRTLCEGGDTAINSAKDMLVAMLIQPYRKMGNSQYNGFAKDMLLGVSGTAEIARPKFLSDQIYGKTIFGQVYNNFNEMGPSAARAVGTITHRTAATTLKTILDGFIAADIIGAGAFNNLHDAASAVTADASAKLLADYMINHMGGSMERLITFITDKKAQLPIRDDDNSRATFAFLVKVISEASMYYISEVGKNRLTHPILNSAVNRVVAGLAVFGTDVDAADKKNDLMTAMRVVPAAGAVAAFTIMNERVAKDILKVAFAGDLLKGKLNPAGAAVPRTRTASDPVRYVPGVGANVLKYLEKRDDDIVGNNIDPSQVQAVDVDAAVFTTLADLGKARFDTVLVRNLIFIVNLYRSLRVKLQRDLNYSRDIIARSAPITRPQLTEYYGNQTYVRPSENSHASSSMSRRYQTMI